MSSKLQAWKKANKPTNRSILSSYAAELFELKKDGYTQEQMLAFLRENGVKTTQQNLSAFLSRAQKNNLKIPQGVKNEEKKVEKPSPALLEADFVRTEQNDTKKSDESQNRANTIDPRFAKMLGLNKE